VTPVLVGIYFVFWRFERNRQERELEREKHLMGRLVSAIREGKIKPTYVTSDLNWKPATGVSNHVELSPAGELHIITDYSTFSYQMTSDIAVGDLEFCYVAYSVEVIKGGASVMILDQKGEFLGSKNLDRIWKYHETMMVRARGNKTLTFVVANDFPDKGQSEFRVAQFDVYFVGSGTNI
jgi:hypothetical protein